MDHDTVREVAKVMHKFLVSIVIYIYMNGKGCRESTDLNFELSG